MHRKKIFLVEDEEDLVEILNFNLERAGFQVNYTSNGEKALNYLKNNTPDLILLDWMLPGLSGLDICRIIKENEAIKRIPVIMLTAKSQDANIVAGVENGADDYVSKPFSPKVLLARMKKILIRHSEEIGLNNCVVYFDEIKIHPERHQVLLGGIEVHLTPSEFKLLYHLARKPGCVYSRDQIIDTIRGQNYAITDRAIDVLIVGLRKKMGNYGKLIETVRGVGYRFSEKK